MNRPLLRKASEYFLPVADLKRFGDGWLLDGQYRQLSEETRKNRAALLEKLRWWIRTHAIERIGAPEIKQFLVYVATGHTEPGGRWGNKRLTKPVRPVTVRDYQTILRTFFHWLVEEGYIEGSPMEELKPPVARQDQIRPFSQEQVAALLVAAKRSRHPLRDEAILLFLLDTAVRASELCELQMRNLDVIGKRAIVLGKGNKHRTVYFGPMTSRALNAYLRGRESRGDDYVFPTQRADQMTRSGLQQLLERLAKVAGIEAVRCSPHTFRHTAAVWFLRNGGQVFALKEMLGHTDLKMTMRYVAVAQADVQDQHRLFGPVSRLGKGR